MERRWRVAWTSLLILLVLLTGRAMAEPDPSCVIKELGWELLDRRLSLKLWVSAVHEYERLKHDSEMLQLCPLESGGYQPARERLVQRFGHFPKAFKDAHESLCRADIRRLSRQGTESAAKALIERFPEYPAATRAELMLCQTHLEKGERGRAWFHWRRAHKDKNRLTQPERQRLFDLSQCFPEWNEVESPRSMLNARAPQSRPPWEMFKDADGSVWGPKAKPSLTTQWRYPMPCGTALGRQVAPARLRCVGDHGYVHDLVTVQGIELSTGRLMWRRKVVGGWFSKGLRADCAVSEGAIAIAQQNTIHAFNRLNGHALWRVDTRSWKRQFVNNSHMRFVSNIVSDGHNFYVLLTVGSEDFETHLVSLNARTGRQRWALKFSDFDILRPSVAMLWYEAGQLIASDGLGSLARFHASGHWLWFCHHSPADTLRRFDYVFQPEPLIDENFAWPVLKVSGSKLSFAPAESNWTFDCQLQTGRIVRKRLRYDRRVVAFYRGQTLSLGESGGLYWGLRRLVQLDKGLRPSAVCLRGSKLYFVTGGRLVELQLETLSQVTVGQFAQSTGWLVSHGECFFLSNRAAVTRLSAPKLQADFESPVSPSLNTLFAMLTDRHWPRRCLAEDVLNWNAEEVPRAQLERLLEWSNPEQSWRLLRIIERRKCRARAEVLISLYPHWNEPNLLEGVADLLARDPAMVRRGLQRLRNVDNMCVRKVLGQIVKVHFFTTQLEISIAMLERRDYRGLKVVNKGLEIKALSEQDLFHALRRGFRQRLKKHRLTDELEQKLALVRWMRPECATYCFSRLTWISSIMKRWVGRYTKAKKGRLTEQQRLELSEYLTQLGFVPKHSRVVEDGR